MADDLMEAPPSPVPLGCRLQTGAGTILNELKPQFGSTLVVLDKLIKHFTLAEINQGLDDSAKGITVKPVGLH